ncbi:MAG TPA: hypothetical protein VK663_07840, partial [Burkholderiales bacterium]|nr:hypothetical protein [Burkholderiales bacterium]
MRERRAGLGVQASHIDSAEPRLPVAVAVWIMAAIVLVAFLQWAGGLLISLLLGIICAYTLAPFVNWLEMRRIHRAVATTLVLSVV